MKPTIIYSINFYYPKGCKDREDYENFDNKNLAIKALNKYKKHYPDYDLKIIKETTIYEEVIIEK